jgi:kynurenine 3-monooxygenase
MKTVSIVGGGLVGSLLASYLGNRGYKVDVYERRPDMRSASISAGKSINMACSTRGWQALDKVGVGEKVRDAAIAMTGRMMHAVNGDLTYQPYGQEGQAIYSISRGGLNKILMSHAEENSLVNFHFNEKCVDVNLEEGLVTFKNSETGKVNEVNSDLIFGADGAFSAVRSSMEHQKHFDYQQKYISSDYIELSIDARGNGDFAMEKNALHIWPRGDFMLIALPNPDGSFTCTLFMPYEGEVSFEQLKTDQDILDFFKRIFPDALELMPSLVEDFRANPQAPLAIIKCYPWTSSGKVALIGDAAHAIVPFYGQGMICGFEDCYVLDQLIDQFDENWDDILEEYQKARKPNGDAIADLAVYNYGVMRDKVADESFLLQKKLELRINQLYPDKYTPLYTMVSFTNTPYAEAYRKGMEQQDFMEKMVREHPVKEKFNDGTIDELIHSWFKDI